MSNVLYYGDNLDVMARHVADDSVDLVYLDPPFNSNATYNVLFAEKDGTEAAAQIKVFEDTWRWDQAAAEAFEETVESGGDVARALQAFRTMLGDSNMLAYIAMMAPRLVELQRVLKPTGSLFLHCDPTASHYLKLLLDAIFGPSAFRNEIIWHYFNKMQGNIRRLASNHDTIFWYSNNPKFKFAPVMELREGGPVRMLKRRWDQSNQRLVNAKDEAGRLLYIERTHRMADDVWRMPMLQPASREMLGFPTQKPLALLQRIIQMTTEPGDTILDPFCGCGTSIVAAQQLDRRWIGIDITHLAVGLIKSRLVDLFGPDVTDTYVVVGEPTTVEDAAQLAKEDPFQFQAWALGLAGARTAESSKKGADKGVDGRLYFHDEPGGKTKQIVFSVKAGKLHATYVRDLRGVMEREKSEIAVMISFDSPTSRMRSEAASAGFYTSPWGKHPKLQLVTVEELLDGKRIDYPKGAVDRTIKRGSRSKTIASTVPLDL